MTKSGRAIAAALAFALLLAWPAEALAAGQGEGASQKLGPAWTSRLDPGSQIPSGLAIRFGKAALSVGLTKGQAAAMMNDERFAMAIGAPDSGYGMLESMIKHPERIAQARILLKNHDLSAWGADSVQNALMEVAPPLRNAYLSDFGLMAVKGPVGALVLVDIETGRQYVGQGRLGTQLRAPGGGPLPEPTVPEPSIEPQPAVAAGIAAATGPGLNFSTNQRPGLGLAPATGRSNSRGLLTPGVYLVAALFLVAWGGYAVVALMRRRRT